MKTFEYRIHGYNASIICNQRNTRNGFAHDAQLFVDGDFYSEASCFYLNRTWERYGFQSVCLKVVRQHAERCVQRIKREYMAERGYKRMTKERNKAFTEWLDNSNDEQLRFWCDLYDAVDNHAILENAGEWYKCKKHYCKPSQFLY